MPQPEVGIVASTSVDQVSGVYCQHDLTQD
jgi:hypothetical protein